MTAARKRPILVPPVFAARTALREGPTGAAWIERLPGIVADACRRWSLEVDGAGLSGEVALVVPVRRGDEPAVLKVTWPHPEAEPEPVALSTWDGQGAVRLLAHHAPDWALLLERADATRALTAIQDADAAVARAAALLPRLHVAPPAGVPTLASMAARWTEELVADWRRLGRPVESRLVGEAVAACRDLGDGPSRRLLHGDLHYDNVLASRREPWLAIDPKPLVGDPAFEVVPLLRNRWADISGADDVPAAVRRRFDHVVEVADLDHDRARRWAVARAVDNALSGVEHGRDEFAGIARVIAAALSEPRR